MYHGAQRSLNMNPLVAFAKRSAGGSDHNGMVGHEYHMILRVISQVSYSSIVASLCGHTSSSPAIEPC